jgi:cell division protein FtsI (penicillin-binding protein 3)
MWIGGISVRLVSLQVNQSEWLREKALNQRRDQVKSKTLRGTIYDRTERTLAMSVKVQSLYADPLEIEDFEGTAKKVAAVLRTSPKEILKELEEGRDKNRRFVWLERKIDNNKVQEINKALVDEEIRKADLPKIAGLHWKEEEKRKYPYGTLASHIIGFSNADDVGQAGIEMSKEDILKGEVIKSWRDRDRLGRVYDESEIEREPPKDIVLTISHSIQYKTEQALEKGVKASNSKSGMAVVLDPKTGEVLAMANYPTFDPNEFNQVSPEVWKNKAVQEVYSPGSVFKVITYGGALEEEIIKPNDTIDGRKGFINVGKRRFEDPHGMKIMTYSEALAISSNFAAIKTALGLGKNKFYYYSQNFGFGEETGIELPAERSGTLRPPEKWSGDSLASMSIGYEVSITALQAASAFAAIANDGVRIKPHIIKEIRQADSDVISRPNPEKTHVLSAEAASDLRGMLQRVVEKGTAKRARLNGYTSAGKTGTAWKYDPKLKKYNPAKYISSFVGMAPAENPSLVIAVVMDEPSGGARDGGQVSAPVFREIAEQVLPELNILPNGKASKEIDEPKEEDNESSEEIKEIIDLPGEIAGEEKSEDKEKENKVISEKPKATENKETEEKKRSSEDKKKPPEKKTPAIKKEKPKSDAKNKSSTERTKKKT